MISVLAGLIKMICLHIFVNYQLMSPLNLCLYKDGMIQILTMDLAYGDASTFIYNGPYAVKTTPSNDSKEHAEIISKESLLLIYIFQYYEGSEVYFNVSLTLLKILYNSVVFPSSCSTSIPPFPHPYLSFYLFNFPT